MTMHSTTTRSRVLAAAGALALVGGLGVAAPGAAQAATPAATTAQTGDGSTGCSTGSLPAVVRGRPASFHAGLARGYWIWHDSLGWHLRVTHATTSRTVFTGVVTATNPMRTVPFRDEAHDRIVRSADRRTTTFRFNDYGRVDGLDFTAGCSATVSFRLYADGHLVAPQRIHLGAKATAATANPVRITRIPAV